MSRDDLIGKVEAALRSVVHPEVKKSIYELDMVKELEVEEQHIRLRLELLTWGSPDREELIRSIKEALHKETGIEDIEITVGVNQRSTRPPLGGGPLDKVKNLLAIASGKGGVGKSTVSSNIAVALAREGAAVGLLDADIYGPSIPSLLSLDRKQLRVKDKKLIPLEKFGVKVMSMGLLVEPGQSVIWRGPVLHGTMQQFCRDVEWGELDFLVVDLPPGTGDVSLSLSQIAPIGGVVVVATPQQVALEVAVKSVDMFGKLNVPVIGLVENMAYYSCPNCGTRDDLFGHGGVKEASRKLKIPVLGEIPLNSIIRKAGDEGVPVVVAEPESAPAQAFVKAARMIAGRLAVVAELGYDAICDNLPDPACV